MIPAASAGDPRENYDEFAPTGRENVKYEPLCRDELGLPMGVQPVGAQRFNLRRCVNQKRADADKEKFILRKQRVRRQKMESEEVQKASQLRFRTNRARERFLRKKVRLRRTFRQKPRGKAESSSLRRIRATKRAGVQRRERVNDKNFVRQKPRRKAVMLSCSGISNAAKRMACREEMRAKKDASNNEGSDSDE